MGPILSTSGCTRGNKDQENDLQSKKMSFADRWIKPSALRNATKQAICPLRSVGIYGQLFSSAFQPDCSTNGNLSLRGGQQTQALDVNYWQQPNCYTISDRKQSILTKDHLCHVSSAVMFLAVQMQQALHVVLHCCLISYSMYPAKPFPA